MKLCKCCNNIKPLSEFYCHPRTSCNSIQISSNCKVCTLLKKKDRLIKKEIVFHTLNCEYCNKEFVSKHEYARFCCGYHSCAIKIDPERKRLLLIHKKEENLEIILNTYFKVEAIAVMFNISTQTVYNIRRKHGIRTKKIPFIKVKKEKAIKLSKKEMKLKKYNEMVRDCFR